MKNNMNELDYEIGFTSHEFHIIINTLWCYSHGYMNDSLRHDANRLYEHLKSLEIIE